MGNPNGPCGRTRVGYEVIVGKYRALGMACRAGGIHYHGGVVGTNLFYTVFAAMAFNDLAEIYRIRFCRRA